MSQLSRRALLGTAGAIGAGAALGGPPYVTAFAAAEDQGVAIEPAQDAIRRLLPDHARQFRLRGLAGDAERFRVTGKSGAIEVAGTSPAVLLTGVHWYLKYVCNAHISWSGSQLRLPKRLPAPPRALTREATVANRFFLNDTHDGYTGPYHSWSQWERQLDIMALHGVNQVLVTPGQEAVYHRLLKDFGYSDDESRTWIPAPSHQPWWLLQNMSEFGGPVSTAGLAKRTDLGRKIIRRLRELGMSPVLPGYFGTVPTDFGERNNGAVTVPQGTWNALQRPDWLDPRTDLFREVAASFYRHQTELFGAAGHFKMDLLHEGGAAGDVPVPEAAKAVQTALDRAHAGATWVILGWQANPRPELLQGVDKKRMLIVDGLSDIDTVTDREKDWGGTPYAFGTIPNFGGRTTLGAKAHNWTARFTAWRDKSGSALVGTAYMPEAAERDPAAFELFSELAWRTEAIDRPSWFAGYARFRYGGQDAEAAKAAAALRSTAYELRTADGRPYDSIFTGRPSLTTASTTYDGAFDQPDFDGALAGLLGVAAGLRGSDAYRHDLADFARQSLANRSRVLLPQLNAAYKSKDLAGFRKLKALWLQLMRLGEEIAGAHKSFLVGPWLQDAKRFATSADEAKTFEWTARVLLTTWAGPETAGSPGNLADYANRDWQGVYADLYIPRWQALLDEYEDALAAGRAPKSIDWYAMESAWTKETTTYPVRPTTDPLRAARKVRDTLAATPYQGTVKVTTDPPALAPGKTGKFTAAFRNENGFAPTGKVLLKLTGLDVKPGETQSVESVAAAGRADVVWEVTGQDAELKKPLQEQPYELSVTHGPAGGEQVTLSRKGNYYLAGPLEDGLKTITNNAAVFGQLDDRFAIEGAGRDLWKGNAEFGAVYRAGVVRDGSVITVKVDAQENTAPWARCGIIVRNDLSDLTSRGFVNLAVTPEQGVVLSYDTNADGTVDTYKRVRGVKAPVTLRLTRAGSSFKGELSTDDGATWREVEVPSVPVTDVAATQDVGLFMSAVNQTTRGLVEFSGWKVG
ncbi:alpha-N-acetylglucosaminidase [Streptomyces boninensis]|uniref:alpha-N-acetylglucosaminidase n=1 Tax=Streptomyces boninensis TaxID=2039455 RepID=UPI003B224103